MYILCLIFNELQSRDLYDFVLRFVLSERGRGAQTENQIQCEYYRHHQRVIVGFYK